MIGVLLSSISSFFGEVAGSIGKFEISNHKESIYTMAFLDLFWGIFIFSAIALFKEGSFVFSLASLPTFGLRAFLEIFQMIFTIIAVVKVERSTFSFIRVGTIPMLLIVDLFLGYSITINQAAGMGIIFLGLILLFLNKSIVKNNIGFVVFTAINAVVTISLYKYDISHFNSVVAEQLVMTVFLSLVSILLAFFVAKENPLKFLKKPIFLSQSVASGLGSVIMSFAYSLAPASIMLAATRSSSVLWAVASGNHYFHEKHILLKIFLFVVLLTGLVLLAV